MAEPIRGLAAGWDLLKSMVGYEISQNVSEAVVNQNHSIIVSNITTPTAGLNPGINSDTNGTWVGLRLLQGFTNALSDQKEHKLSARGSLEFLDRSLALVYYCCSLYGFSCLMLALILDRTMTIASANDLLQQQLDIDRNRGRSLGVPKLAVYLKKFFTIILRLLVIGFLLYNGYNVLVALKLVGQIGTSGTGAGVGPWYMKFLQSSFFDYDPDWFNTTKYMATLKTQVMIGPNADMYWPIFLTYCFLAFVETFSSVIQGKKPSTESGITIFEHSIAFQEAGSRGFDGHMRTPSEQVLFASLFLIANHLNIQIGGILNDNKYKLIPLSITGISFLIYVLKCTYDLTVFKFSSIFVTTFLPQVLLVFIIAISGLIFGMAFIANGFQMGNLNCASLFVYDNDLEDEPNNRLNISLSDDFYKCLWSVGMFVITLAGKSSYITELSFVAVDKETWLERGIWESLTKSGSPTKNVVQYLKKNHVTGYSNIVQQPSLRMITGKDDNEMDEGSGNSVYWTRYQYLSAALTRFGQLIYGLVVTRFCLTFVPSLFRRRSRPEQQLQSSMDETVEEFEARKLAVPAYLRKYMRIRSQDEAEAEEEEEEEEEEVKEIVYTSDDDYINMLQGIEIPDIDCSPDYDNEINEEDDEDDDDEDSDDGYETIDLQNIEETGGKILKSVNDEFMNVQEFNELINSPDIGILQFHLQYKGSGRLTRSKFLKLQTEEDKQRDEGAKLLELLLSKRVSENDKDKLLSHNEKLEDRLVCAICQVNYREIITWPCKCFAICESCRLSLVAKGIEGCVCCRRDVEGVTKIYIP
ncbi:uncharacterized protein KQ657_002311 [Scheffersomyces spartinae]|uniref:Uncharacterized protein n=1 Tax=Scheffersomyces spartinae TaxID=45513 RepID=A0A9P7VD64_9ASCO|nr:uncharacterized protein KQ657_002311 [Scheffersomyces spartinae]KAG7195925.1 hypothetical protein KQ657_002311 [Scheffersomyces spartinae]